MSFFGKLFGTDAAITSTIGAVKEGLDALVYTDEEKAAEASKERAAARSMLVEWMQATQGQNLARRLISLAITGVWLLQYVVATAASSLAVFWTSQAANLTKLAEVQIKTADQMNGPVMLILAFYFAAPHMGDFAQAIIGRFQKKV
jgi:hypothetical protein